MWVPLLGKLGCMGTGGLIGTLNADFFLPPIDFMTPPPKHSKPLVFSSFFFFFNNYLKMMMKGQILTSVLDEQARRMSGGGGGGGELFLRTRNCCGSWKLFLNYDN